MKLEKKDNNELYEILRKGERTEEVLAILEERDRVRSRATISSAVAAICGRNLSHNLPTNGRIKKK